MNDQKPDGNNFLLQGRGKKIEKRQMTVSCFPNKLEFYEQIFLIKLPFVLFSSINNLLFPFRPFHISPSLLEGHTDKQNSNIFRKETPAATNKLWELVPSSFRCKK